MFSQSAPKLRILSFYEGIHQSDDQCGQYGDQGPDEGQLTADVSICSVKVVVTQGEKDHGRRPEQAKDSQNDCGYFDPARGFHGVHGFPAFLHYAINGGAGDPWRAMPAAAGGSDA